MSNLLQVAIPAAIPAVLAFLVAYQGALSRTGRLRRNVKADVELLAALPPEHPSREALEGHVGELVDELIRREQLQYFPVGGLGWIFGLAVVFVVFLAAAAVLAALAAAAGSLNPLPTLVTAAVYGLLAILLTPVLVRAWRRSRRPRTAVESAVAARRTTGDDRSGGLAGPPPTPDSSEGA
jgi:Flp pilus assembly protein TadB